MDKETNPAAAGRSKRLLLACEKCRVLKVKCVRYEDGQSCVKCTKAHSQCIIPEPKQRPRQAQRAKPRLVELDSKLTHLLGLLSQPKASPTVGEPSVDESPAIARSRSPALAGQVETDRHQTQTPAGWIGHESLPEIDMDPNLIETLGSTTEYSLNTAWLTPPSMDNAWITDLNLSPVVLQHLLDSFRGMVSYFPFVLIPVGWTAASMAEERPFLLLAAVICASSGCDHLQQALIEEFKEILSHRVIMAGEKDIDLLQGLLVHLAWFHFRLDPRSQQTYQYLQMAIGMVIDLGLDQRTADLVDQQTQLDDSDSREACRAYLGCFYLSSITTTSTGKPNNLPFSEHVLCCAVMLQREHEFQSDELIYPVIKLQQFVEEVYETYRLGNAQIHGLRFYSLAERLITRLEDLWSSVSAELRRAVLLTNGYHAAKILILEMGLVYRYGQRERPSQKASGHSAVFAPSKIILNLSKCVIASKEYLDLFVAMPADEYSKLPLAIWYQVILAIIVLYRLSIGLSDFPDWNSDIAQETVDLEEYLGILGSRLQSTKTETEGPPPHITCLFLMLPEIIESVKTSYISAKRHPDHAHDESHAHGRFAGDVTRSMPSSARGPYRCPGMRNLRRLPTTKSTDEFPFHSSVAAEIERIENEKFWSDLLVADAFPNTSSAFTGH